MKDKPVGMYLKNSLSSLYHFMLYRESMVATWYSHPREMS